MTVLSIVIPAFNEESAIGEILERVLRERDKILNTVTWLGDVEVIVVDDGSEDRTKEIARHYAGVVVVEHERNRGYGAALKTGFEAARGELIGFLDADGTYPPEMFARLCEVLRDEEADIVLGSRLAGEVSEMPVQRKVGNIFFARLLSWIVDRRITDTASGMRVFKKNILPKLAPLPDGLNLTPAMSTRALHEHLNIVEVPIPYRERVGSSKLSAVKDGMRFLRTIVGIARLYNPLKFFGLIGLAMIALGCYLSIEPIWYYLNVRRVEDWEIYRLFTIMVLFVTGINVITFGAFSNYILSLIHQRDFSASSVLGRLLLRPPIIRKFAWIGWACLVSAVLLNYRTIFEYISTGKIFIHWSYILTGATLFLVGAQLLMASFLIKVLDELAERNRLGLLTHESVDRASAPVP